MKKKSLLIVFSFLCTTLFAQNNFWKSVEANQITSFTKGQQLFTGSFKPAVYKLFSLDETALTSALKQAPLRTVVAVPKSHFIIAIPLANGSIAHFRVSESPVMQPGLQAKYPNIRTYVGQGIEDRSSVIHFDVTPLGFHAIILSAEKSTVYINPVTTANQLYVVFDRSNISQEKQVFDCKLEKILNSSVQGTEKPFTTSDGNLRTYRFAVTTGGEFSKLCLTGNEKNNAQKKASVLSVLVTDLNRTNAIFETDFGVHLNYVNNEDTIIFLNGSTDPFQSSANGYFTGKWNTQSQQTLDNYIGSSNYDVGHLLMGYATGGNAGCIGCVCDNSLKGSGATGFTTDLTTDPFIVDFWDHEIGHQFGGNHTFDFSYEGTIAQMEPGSGSTIMGYAGTTGSTDIQPHSDPYFHAVSIQQIDDYVTNGFGNTCAVVTSAGNTVPTVKAGKDYTIPKSTPFTLTANGSDADDDSLTYCWEQYDVYQDNGTSNRFPDSTSTTGPVFRSLTPVISTKRNFPALPSILDGTNNNEWEVLPSVNRTLNFRVTVRDNHPGGGSTNSDDMVVTVDANAGPFKITNPNTNVSWAEGSHRVILWNVANTDNAPVNCSHVNIMLSLDGGNTFPIKLKSNIPNNGKANIYLPMQTTSQARIKVVAVNNIFFDISDMDFKITATGKEDNTIAADVTSIAKIISVQPNPANNYTNVIFNVEIKSGTLVLTNEQGKILINKTLNSIEKGFTEKISLQQFTKGIYFIKISSGTQSQTEKIVID